MIHATTVARGQAAMRAHEELTIAAGGATVTVTARVPPLGGG